MDEKKIFFAYTYRALGLLYRHLYRIKAYLLYDNLYCYDEEEQCGCIDTMPTALSSLAFHYRVAKEVDNNYNNSIKISKYLDQAIQTLLDGQTPSLIDATYAGLYNPKFDQYNPIFTSPTAQ